MNKPKLSISCVTYNHEQYIRQALEGFVMQKTSFPFEVLIYDDASTDKTQQIIREYEEKYPNIIKPIYQTENQWSKNIDTGLVYNGPRILGEYVALCDGDDYWIDEYKLQKQVDFLDANPNYTICFHYAKVVSDNKNQKDEIYPKEIMIRNKLTMSRLLQFNFITTASVVYRWKFNGELKLDDIFPQGILPIDWYLHLLHAKDGHIGLINEVMSVYRIHNAGIWNNWWTDRDQAYLKDGIKMANFFYHAFQNIVNHSESYRKTTLFVSIYQIYSIFHKYYEFDKCKQVEKMFPDLISDIQKEIIVRQDDFRKKMAENIKKYRKISKILGILTGILLFIVIYLLSIVLKGTVI